MTAPGELRLRRREQLRAAGVYLVTEEALSDGRTSEDVAAAALAVDADGVHLGQDDLPVATARASLGPDALIGLSITDPAQLEALDVRDADYLGVGAVFPTGSKADARYTGLELLAAARAAVDVPIVAIGGITLANAAAAVLAGADVVAVISAIAAAPDPGLAARQLLEAVTVAGRARPGGAGQARPRVAGATT